MGTGQIKRHGRGVPLPINQQPLMDMRIEGFVPIIIHVAPANIPLLLGWVDDKHAGVDIGYEHTSSPQDKREKVI